MQELAPKMDIFDMSTVQSELREILGQEQQLLLADIDQLQALLDYETTMQVRTRLPCLPRSRELEVLTLCSRVLHKYCAYVLATHAKSTVLKY
jgi:Coiled-coil domain-containing protein 24 family